MGGCDALWLIDGHSSAWQVCTCACLPCRPLLCACQLRPTQQHLPMVAACCPLVQGRSGWTALCCWRSLMPCCSSDVLSLSSSSAMMQRRVGPTFAAIRSCWAACALCSRTAALGKPVWGCDGCREFWWRHGESVCAQGESCVWRALGMKWVRHACSIGRHAMAGHDGSCRAMPCHATTALAVPCLAMPRRLMPWHAVLCLLIPCDDGS